MEDPVDDLVVTLRRVVPGWLERCVVQTADRSLGRCPEALRTDAAVMAAARAPDVVDAVERLVRTDVDEQRGTPLTLLREAVRFPTEVLTAAAVPAPEREAFATEHFPHDRYGLAPASWDDIDPDLREPGIMWGAWKAATVMRRRRPGGDAPTMT
jgi:hypothetical protein